MRWLIIMLAAGLAACGTEPPAPAVSAEVHQRCMNQMQGARTPHSAPVWHFYDYCVRQSQPRS
jgi:uncharacterized lipoprotein YmbA